MWSEDEVPLGPKQSLTSEGFLLCRDVPLARIGVQHYAPYELPGVDGLATDRMIEVQRTPDEVFHPASIRSFEGKPLVDEHPAGMVDPGNIEQHQIGHVFNVRRGDPPGDDVLLGDLMITSPRGIQLVRNGKRAVSVGYAAGYEPTGSASARQTKIRANHIALVDEGRCGDRCMIGDRAMAAYTDPWLTEQSRGVKLDESWANLQGADTPNPGEEAGGDLVQTLPGDVSSYFIAKHPTTGKAALYRYRQPQIDPGTVGRSSGTMARTMDRRPEYYRSVARGMNVLRETTGAVLKGINAANAKAWSNQGGRDG